MNKKKKCQLCIEWKIKYVDYFNEIFPHWLELWMQCSNRISNNAIVNKPIELFFPTCVLFNECSFVQWKETENWQINKPLFSIVVRVWMCVWAFYFFGLWLATVPVSGYPFVFFSVTLINFLFSHMLDLYTQTQRTQRDRLLISVHKMIMSCGDNLFKLIPFCKLVSIRFVRCFLTLALHFCLVCESQCLNTCMYEDVMILFCFHLIGSANSIDSGQFSLHICSMLSFLSTTRIVYEMTHTAVWSR